MSDNKKKTCFVLSPIGAEGSLIRNQANLVFKYVIEPAVKKAGYDNPMRADHDPNPSLITNTIIQHIFNDDLVVGYNHIKWWRPGELSVIFMVFHP